MENKVQHVVKRPPALCLVSIFSSSSTSLSPGHISLRGLSPGNYSAVWEGDTASSLTQTCCYKSTLCVAVCVCINVCWGGSHLDPTLPRYIWPANKPTVILDSTHGENTHAQQCVCGGDTPSSRFIK